MARHLAKLWLFINLTVIILGTQAKTVHKRSLNDVKCHESGRFYRNPDRLPDKQWTMEECAKYYLCLEGDVFEFRCSQNLLFDVNRQLCDQHQNVHNCDVTTETKVARPLLQNATCANETHLACGDGTCQQWDYFCDGSIDCPDGSDESWCDVHHDPNAAAPCDPSTCQLPSCFCTVTGRQIPAKLLPNQTPQMITITFDGPVNHENWDLFTRQIFAPENRNPNNCPISGTFFVTHAYTNYRHVQKLWNDGHEIAVNSITHRGPEDWWSTNATVEDWFDEMVGQANIANRFARVRMEDFRGLRVPYYSVGWNRQFMMMQEFGFVYDATVVAPAAGEPFWPYTLDYKMPHLCTGHNQYCPTRSYPGVWEMVINPMTAGDQKCPTLQFCPSPKEPEDVYDMLMENFKRHYDTNRAPFGIHLNSEWFKSQIHMYGFKSFLKQLLTLPDVYFVTEHQVIEWIKKPTPINQLKKFQPWQCKPIHYDDYEMACAQPNTCKLSSKVLQHDKYMITCSECPKSYPWLRNEFGFE